MIFQEGVWSCSPIEYRVSHTTVGIASITVHVQKAVIICRKFYMTKLNFIFNLPALTASVPSGRHISPDRRNMKTEFSGSVWKYSPSST